MRRRRRAGSIARGRLSPSVCCRTLGPAVPRRGARRSAKRVAAVEPRAAHRDGAAQRSRGRARRRCASAIAAGRSPASSCCPTAATRAAAASAPRQRRAPIFAHRHRRRRRPARIAKCSSVTAAEAVLDDSRVDLAVSAVSHGFGTAPIELRLLENGRPIDVRRVDAGGGRHAGARGLPGLARRGAPTVYTVETPVGRGELVPENNARSVLVQPPARPRRVLLVEGAPGFEHSFLKRAWAADPGLEVDSVVRKGKNEQGADTFYVQAAQSRGDALTAGYPANARGALSLRRARARQRRGASALAARSSRPRAASSASAAAACWCSARARFARAGPRRHAARGRAAARSRRDQRRRRRCRPRRARGRQPRGADPGGRGPSRSCSWRRRSTRRASAGRPCRRSRRSRRSAARGPAPACWRSASGPAARPRALVAVQRYGDGRSMVFTGEASWRWRMLLPSSDRRTRRSGGRRCAGSRCRPAIRCS